MVFRRNCDLSQFENYLDLSRFQYFLTAVSNNEVALVNNRYLIVTWIYDDFLSKSDPVRDDIQLALEFDDDTYTASAICWLTNDTICVGFLSGIVAVFSTAGEELLEFTGRNTSVQALRKSPPSSSEDYLWILYEDSYLVSLPIGNAVQGSTEGIQACKFAEHGAVNDFVFFPSPVSSSVFEVDDTRLWKTSIVVGGYDNALSIYSLGDQLHFQDFSKLTGYVKERVNGLLTKSVMSLYGMVGGKGKSHVNEDAARIENECKLVTSIVDFTDGKRRILRMSIEPGNSRYIASADSLGRVTLFDCQVQGIVRIWKGLRDARLAWTNDVQTEDVTGEETVGNNIQLCLAIYAPLLGLLSFYVMSHGPCIRVIPVGMHCQICTLLNSFGSVQCLLLRPEATSKKLEFVFVSPGETSDSDLDVRQAQLGVIDSDGGSSLQLSRKIVMTEELRTMTVGQFRKILSDLLEELVFAFHNVKSADSSALLDMCVATEDKILPLLAKIDNNNDLKEWVACYRLVECSELYGVVDAPHETYHTPPDKTADNFIVVSHIPLRLSPKLHRLLLSKISDSVAALTEENVEINSFAKLKLRNELAGVLKLLEGFEVLNAVCYSEDPNSDGKVCETFDDDNSFKASPLTSTSEDAAIICRQNTFRAEALCWNLRLSKKFDFVREKHRSSESPVNSSSRKSSSFELQRNIISPTNLEVLGSSLPNNSPHPIRHPSISPLDASTLKFAIRNISMYQCNFTQFRVFFGLHQSDLIDQSDVPTIGIKTADLQKCMRLDTAVESSTIYTRSTTKTVLSSTPTTPMEMDGELRGIDSFNVSCMKRQHKSVCPVYFTTIRFQSVFCWSCLMQIKNAIRDDNLLQMSGHNMLGTFGLSYGVVKLLAKPLLGESFALGRYLSGLKAINLQRAEISLVKVLPLFASFLELQKPSVIIGDLLAKRIATSPFQRWFRDMLLALEAEFNLKSEDLSIGMEEETVVATAHDLIVDLEMETNNNYCDALDQTNDKLVAQIADVSDRSYDRCVRILLLKTYSILQSSNKLETSLAIASIILETLNVVNDQIERRSYGESHLKDTIRSWEILIRKIRVVLLLCSRASYRVFEFNVDNFDKGLISIHKVLAEDTLCFTTKADQSAEHERRCYEVYQRKLDGGGLETHNNRSDILLAWGPIADRRWRDLMGIALSDDTIEKKNSSPAQSSNSPTNRTSGQHSHEKKHEVNNNKTLADKQNGAAVKRRRPLLLYFPNHYNPDYLGSHRAILCFERWNQNAGENVDLLSDAVAHLFSVANNIRAAVAADLYDSFISPFMKVFVAMEDDSITYELLQSDETLHSVLHQVKLFMSKIVNVRLLHTFITSCTELLKFVSIGLSAEAGMRKTVEAVMQVEDDQDIWPSIKDWKIDNLTASFSEKLNDKIALGFCLKWNKVMMWVMLLRFQCGLRGVKPSELIDSTYYDSMLLISSLSDTAATYDPQLSYEESFQISRVNFVYECFRRVVLNNDPSETSVSVGVLYSLSSVWDLDLTAIRLVHIQALLSAYKDDEVEILLQDMNNDLAIVDLICAALRKRIGEVVAVMEKSPVFGPFVARMDAEAVDWVLKAVQKNKIDLGKNDYAMNINIPSTRHLIISLQGILLGIPLEKRGFIYDDMFTLHPSLKWLKSFERDENVAKTWFEKKGKCDALLSLSTSLAQKLSSQK